MLTRKAGPMLEPENGSLAHHTIEHIAMTAAFFAVSGSYPARHRLDTLFDLRLLSEEEYTLIMLEALAYGGV
jgi:hypothetical protein